MMGSTHLLLGAASGVATIPLAPNDWAVLIVAGMLGGLLPDLDSPTSALGRRVRPVSATLCKIFGHRGGTHSLAFMAAIGGLGAMHTQATGVALALGILSHILADAVSFSGKKPRLSIRSAGVMLAWPLSSRKFGIRLFRYGGFVERAIVAPGVLLIAAFYVQASLRGTI